MGVVLKDQMRRLKTLVHGGNIVPETRFPIKYQTKPGKILTKICKKKKLLPPQEFMVKTKMLHSSAALIAPVEMQNLSSQISSNIQLLRGVGDIDDRWDRYCAIRQTGQASYVTSRNTMTTESQAIGEGPGKTGGRISDLKVCKVMNGP